MTKIIVVTGSQRSGTTVFRQLLSSVRFTDCGEVLHADFWNNRARFFHYILEAAIDDIGAVHPTRQLDTFSAFLDILAERHPACVVIYLKYNRPGFLVFGIGRFRLLALLKRRSPRCKVAPSGKAVNPSRNVVI